VQPLMQWKSNKYYIFRVCVALGIQHAISMRHTVISGLTGRTVFVHIIS